MTLPELLIAITILGLIITVLSSTVVVTLRQQSSSEGRLNVARAEQNIGMWLPGDLASAATVSVDPAATPCGGDVCPDFGLGPGSNALMLSWSIEDEHGNVTYTNVSYFFSQAADGTFLLTRIECMNAGAGWSCSTSTVLRDLPGPPGGLWDPGFTKPDWVIKVSEPLAPEAIDESEVEIGDSNIKNARRVVVTVNGGGSTDGAGGGTNQISITAGGTYRNSIEGTSLQGAPSFIEARSKCGGKMTLVVDESNSIGDTNIATVKSAVRQFVETLVGTPVELQVVGFHTRSHVLGTTEWDGYFNMTNEAEVATLLGAIDGLRGSWPSSPDGGTNWEEALFRTFFAANGDTAPNLPETVVFFTDGVPTFDRTVHLTSPGELDLAEPPPAGAGWPVSTGSVYSQVAFNRANYWATWARASISLVGVAVGDAIYNQSMWLADPTSTEWARGSRTYQRATTWTYKTRYSTRQATSGAGNVWVPATLAEYNAVTTSTLKRNQGSTTSNWDTFSGTIAGVSADAIFSNKNTANGSSDGFIRTNIGDWVWVTTAERQANQGTLNAELYRSQTTEWSTSGPDWATVTAPSNPSSPGTGYVRGRPMRNDRIIGNLIAGGDNYVEAVWSGGKYTNVETANLYASNNWGQLPVALKTIALGECGGTLTLQTRLNGTPASDPFTYQNSQQFAADGTPVTIDPKSVRTNRQFTTGTFDFEISEGLYREVVILPQELSDLGTYQPGGWACKAGNQPRSFVSVDIPGAETSPWKGIRVRVAANEAVSCTQTVSRP